MSRPTNLYELCEQVCDSIEGAPLNYYQEMWAVPARRAFERERRHEPARGETCGTAFCRAGWMVACLGEVKPGTEESTNNGHIFDRANSLLLAAGIPDDDIRNLFSATGGYEGPGQTHRHEWGSPEYVEAGVAGMREFMNKHEDKLRAAPIKKEVEP